MRTSLVVCCCVFALQCLPSMLCLPVRGSSRYKVAPVSERFPDLKKRGKLPHIHDLVKETNTSNTWNRPRCGVPDYPTLKEVHYQGRHRQRRFVLYGGRLEKTDLTYRIVRFPWQMGEEKVRRVFQEALKIWSDVTPLTFTEIHSGKADIRIDFTRYWHGDNLPFDGPGGILAHAFFPKTHRQGDIHFDYDESWTLGNHMGTDLLQVAAHEFGHVLGLQHSRVPGAIMSAYYSFSYPLRLSEDDKQGIQKLYGTHPKVLPSPPPPPPPPSNPETNEIVTNPDACQTDFDAVSMIRGELFFFKSGYVWRIRDGHLESGYPALASRHWRGIPDNIDAANKRPSLSQERTTGCSMLRGRSEGRSPSGVWVCRCPGSRRLCAGATTPTTTPTSSSQAATGGSARTTTVWSPSTRAACKTGAASPTMWTPPSGTSTV